MGLDLRLLPLDHLHRNDERAELFGYSHTVLRVPSDYDLFDAIKALLSAEVVEIPRHADISSYVAGTIPDGSMEGESCYANFNWERGDSYGDSYTWVAASKLAEVFEAQRPELPVTAYLRALASHGDPLIILDWH